MIIYTLPLDSGGFRVPLRVKVAASSRTPASRRPGVCVHMHTRVCTHTCIHHSKTSEKEKGRKKERKTYQLALPGPGADLGRAFGSRLAVRAAAKPSSLQITVPLLPRPQALPTVFKVEELVLAGGYGAVAGQGSATQMQTNGGGQRGPLRWLGGEAVGGSMERCLESCGPARTSPDPSQKTVSSLPTEAQSSPSPGWPFLQRSQASTKQAAEPTDQIGAIYSVHSPVKCSNKNLWTLASCFNFFLSKKKKKCPMELKGLKKKKEKEKAETLNSPLCRENNNNIKLA